MKDIPLYNNCVKMHTRKLQVHSYTQVRNERVDKIVNASFTIIKRCYVSLIKTLTIFIFLIVIPLHTNSLQTVLILGFKFTLIWPGRGFNRTFISRHWLILSDNNGNAIQFDNTWYQIHRNINIYIKMIVEIKV